MPSTLLPNDIAIEVEANPDPSVEVGIAFLTQPTPTIDQEKTIILFACQLSMVDDDATGAITLRCYRCGGEFLGDFISGVQVGGDITAAAARAAMADETWQSVMCFWVDSGAQSANYVVTAEEDSGDLIFINGTLQAMLLSVGS